MKLQGGFMNTVDYLIFVPFSIWALWVGSMNVLNMLDTDILREHSRYRKSPTEPRNGLSSLLCGLFWLTLGVGALLVVIDRIKLK
jgi:hypothetical protein